MSWQEKLLLLKEKQTVIIGIGNPLRMDDAIGMLITDKLQTKFKIQTFQNPIVYQGGITPEDYLPIILSEKPGAVIIIDACNCGLSPGEIILLNGDRLPDRSNSTHSLSPRVIGSIIQKFAGSEVFYLGIQAVKTGFGEELTPEVREAGDKAIEYFLNLFS